MGLIRELFGLGSAVKDVAEVFTPNKTKQARFEHLEHAASVEQFGTEFKRSRGEWFNNLVDGLNRLPRPVLALGTVGLFSFAMISPVHFSVRMQGLDTIPVELWWLLGAIVSFYFGARELHYVRKIKKEFKARRSNVAASFTGLPKENNAAVADWQRSQK